MPRTTLKLKTTSIKTNPDIWKWAKVYAARAPMTVSELVEVSLREYIKLHPLEEKADKESQQS